ncbi:hypothetical protein V8G54_033263 [Vigna mungo]|uniref:Uncharacterized protein n=1 Tax=Vigna mungo TaxID=3915 RepID=A0AAQ3MNI9_VIGMU
MAGRKHGPSSFTRLAHSSFVVAVCALEDCVDKRHHEIQNLITDNQCLTGIHVALNQNLAATQDELCRLSATAVKVKAERDGEVCVVAAVSTELDQVWVDVQELAAAKKGLAAHLQTVDRDLERTHIGA